MIARGVVADDSVAVAECLEDMEEVVEGGLVHAMAEGERADDVDKRCAVEGLERDGEAFFAPCFESGGSVGDVEQLSCEP